MRTAAIVGICALLSACIPYDKEYLEWKAQQEAADGVVEPEEPAVNKPANTDSCIYIGKVGEWEAFDPYNLYVEDSSDGNQYLITMRSMCLGMQGKVRISFPYKQGRVCRNGGERLAYREFNLTRTCATSGWQTVGSRNEARDLYEATR